MRGISLQQAEQGKATCGGDVEADCSCSFTKRESVIELLRNYKSMEVDEDSGGWKG